MRADDSLPIGMIESTERWPGLPRRVEVGGPGGASAAAAPKAAPVVTDVEALRALLGERFGDLVKLEEKVGCTDALLDMASDDDNPQGRLVRTLLKASTSSLSTSAPRCRCVMRCSR